MSKVKCVIPVLLLLMFLMNSCYNSTHITRTKAFHPNASEVHLRINMSDLELVGETEINISYQQYRFLFFLPYISFSRIKQVNGETYDPYHKNITNISGLSFGMTSKLNKASNKIIEEYPGAAYYYIVYKKKAVERIMFMGKEVNEKAVIRVYDYKINLNNSNKLNSDD